MLRRLDPRLYLVRNRHPRTRQLVWEVRQWVGSAVTPELVLEWTDDAGRPLPLSTGVVYAVERRKEWFGRNIVREAERRNDELRRRASEETAEALREIGEEFERHRRVGSFAIVPRSPGLARTRARMRSEGKA